MRGHDLIDALTGIATAIIGVAIIAVIVGRNAKTASVIGSAGKAFSSVLGAAMKPVS